MIETEELKNVTSDILFSDMIATDSIKPSTHFLTLSPGNMVYLTYTEKNM